MLLLPSYLFSYKLRILNITSHWSGSVEPSYTTLSGFLVFRFGILEMTRRYDGKLSMMNVTSTTCSLIPTTLCGVSSSLISSRHADSDSLSSNPPYIPGIGQFKISYGFSAYGWYPRSVIRPYDASKILFWSNSNLYRKPMNFLWLKLR